MNHQHILTASSRMLYHGSWVKYSVGHMGHGSLEVTHRLPCYGLRDFMYGLLALRNAATKHNAERLEINDTYA